MTKIQLKRSSILNSSTVSRAPTASQLDYGELAINYNSADPQFFIKDSSGSVIRVLDAYAKVDGTTFTGDVNFDGNVKIKGDSTNGAGKLTLSCETDTYSVNIKAPPTSAAASYTLTLPTSAGSNSQVLTTDGSGGLSWAVSSMSTADKNKLDGIESGATADQTGAEIKTLYEAEADTNAFTDALLNKLNNIASGAQVNVPTNLGKSTATTSITITSSTGTDVTIGEATGSIAGLMSTSHHNKLDGIESGATADQTASEILTAIKTVDGSGSGLDADLLDGIQGSSYLRSDTSDTFSGGTLTVNGGSGLAIKAESADFAEQLEIHRNHASNSPAIKFSNDTGQVGILYADPTGNVLRWRDGTSTNNYEIWHAGNDGSGSGLDADTLDGAQPSVSAGNNTIVKRHSSGYIFANYFNTTPNDVSSGVTKVCVETGNDGYIRHGNADAIRAFIDDGRYLRSNATDTSSQRISFQANATNNWDNIATSTGSQGSIEVYNTGSGNDAFMSFHTGGDFACYFGLDADNNSLSVGGWSMGANKYKIWHTGNDGSGSGLDADSVDGIQGGSFLRSDANDVIGGVLSYHSDTARLQFRNTSYNTYLYIGGWTTSNSNGISRIRNSSNNLHIDSAANGHLYLNHYSTGTIYARGQTVWHAGNDGAGSGLDADNLDGKTWDSSGKNLRGTEIYADNWFRNYNNGEGLYNEANAMYWYSDSNARWRLRSNQSSAQIIFATSGNSVRGYVYANSSNDIGFLDSDGGWAVRCVRDNYVELRDNDEVTFRAGQGGVDGNYGTVSTHGGGKGGWEGYSINGRYVWMHDGGNAAGLYNDVDNEWHVYMVRNSYVRLYHNGSTCFETTGSSSANIGGSKVWHAGNDGSGSGLDADTLDGINSEFFLRSDISDQYSGTINGSGSFAVSRESSYTPGAGNTNQGIVLRSTRVAYFSYNGVGAYFNRNSDGDLISYRRSGTEEGSVEINTSRVYFRTTSDYRRKINVNPIANGVDVIKALNPSSYNWIEDNRLDHGFLAHEIQEHIPGSASGYKDEVDEEGQPVYQKVDLTTVVPFLTAALKDSIARIESLEATVAALESQYAS